MPTRLSLASSRAKAWVVAHKALSTLVAVALLSGAYASTKSSSAASTSYVLGTATVGTISETVSGSGQVAASNEVDVAAKASGAITGVNVKVGQQVGVGQQLASIDPGDAGLQLKQAQLSYKELLASKSANGQQAGNSVTQSQQSLESSYTTARTSILSQDAALTTAVTNLQNLLANNGYLASANSGAFAASEHSAAVRSTQQASSDLMAFSAASRDVTTSSDAATLQSVLSSGVQAALSVSLAAKDAQTELDRIRESTNNQNNSADATSAYATVTAALSTANSATTALQSAGQGIITAQNNLAQTQTSAQNTTSQSSDVLSAELNVEEKQQAYSNFFVTSPISGIVAKINLQVGDQAGSGTAVATVLTKQQIAQITLNEVDAAKVKVGDKAKLTFDAIDGLTLTGTVAEVDLVGTVSQGVVSYGAKITLDAGDSRITSGMTVNADITTASADGAVIVPSTAVTTVNGKSYVRVLPSPSADVAATSTRAGFGSTTGTSTYPGAAAFQRMRTVTAASVTPQRVEVTTGITDGTNTQILTGLTAGQTIVVRTETTTAKTAAAAATTRTTGTGAARAGNASFGGATRIGG